MRFEEEIEEPDSTPPKLLLFSQRFNKPDLQGGLTPPPQTIATMPFQWEVAPGKPRNSTITSNDLAPKKSKFVRSLDFPPRIFNNSVTSPTTMLHGPYGMCSPDRMVGKSKCMIKMPWTKIMRKDTSSPKCTSWSWDTSRDISSRYSGGGRFSSYSSSDDFSNSNESKSKINNVNRSHSSILFNKTTSGVLESMFESINRAVPWKH